MKVYLYIPDKGTMEEFQTTTNREEFDLARQLARKENNSYFTLYEDGDVLHKGTKASWENLPENAKAAFTLVRNL